MAKVLLSENILTNIANSIRHKTETSSKLYPTEMSDAIESIETYPEPTGTLSITQNGTANVKDYASAIVNVPNSYVAADEGKVVNNGALVSQTSQTVTQNGTYDTTLINSLIANISGGGGGTILPSEYQAVLYVRGDGAAYVDTGIKPTSTTKVEVVFVNQNNSYGNAFLFGSRHAYLDNMYGYLTYNTGESNKGRVDFGSVSTTHSINYQTINVLRFNMNGFSLNGTSIYVSDSFTSNDRTMYLLGMHNDELVLSSPISKSMILAFRVRNGDSLAMNLIPCKKVSNSEAGFYDTVSGSFFGNANSRGSLIAGLEISIS